MSEASNLLIAVLRDINRELCRIQWNIHQEIYNSPFENTGNSFSDPDVSFEVQAYSWTDDNQEWNFKWKDVVIKWYKYLPRGATVNQNLSPVMIELMLNDCLESLERYEKKHESNEV